MVLNRFETPRQSPPAAAANIFRTSDGKTTPTRLAVCSVCSRLAVTKATMSASAFPVAAQSDWKDAPKAATAVMTDERIETSLFKEHPFSYLSGGAQRYSKSQSPVKQVEFVRCGCQAEIRIAKSRPSAPTNWRTSLNPKGPSARGSSARSGLCPGCSSGRL